MSDPMKKEARDECHGDARGAPVDFDRLSDSVGTLIAQAVVRACAGMNVNVGDVIEAMHSQSIQK